MNARGFTMVEAVVSIVIVGAMLTAALSAVGASRGGQLSAANRSRGLMLAEDLMSEALALDYAGAAEVTLGRTAAEAATGNRSLFNDVDDYTNWSETPPRDRSGAVIDGFTGWTRGVAVAWVSTANPTLVQGSDTGLKRVTVTVSWNGKVMARLMGLRSRGGQNLTKP